MKKLSTFNEFVFERVFNIKNDIDDYNRIFRVFDKDKEEIIKFLEEEIKKIYKEDIHLIYMYSGSFGLVFNIYGKDEVIKFTSDISEAKNIKSLITKKFDFVAKYNWIKKYKYDGCDVFIISMEKVKPLNDDEEYLLDIILSDFFSLQTYDYYKNELPDSIFGEKNFIKELDSWKYRDLTQNYNKSIKFHKEILNILNKSIENNFKFYDLHCGNFGYRIGTNKLVIIDPGFGSDITEDF